MTQVDASPVVARAVPAGRRAGVLVPLGALGLWLLLVAGAELLGGSSQVGSTCLFRNLTGAPCPTCGSTRAVRALLAGHPLEAVSWNPMVTLGAGAVTGWLLLWRGSGRSTWLPTSRRGRGWLWTVAAIVFIANWAYVIASQGDS